MARNHRTIATAAAALATVLLAALAPAGTASAHIDPQPPQAPAGSTLPVGFTVQHGCGESPTVRLDMRLPEDVSDPVPVAPDGWDGEISETDDGDTVVTFSGGPLPADVEETFTVEMTLPATPDAVIFFPFVQRCVEGEIRWIDIPTDGSGDGLDEPAPAMLLTAPVATTTAETTTTTTVTTAAPAATAEAATTAAGPTSTAATTTTAETTSSAPDTAPPATEGTTSPSTDEPSEDDDGSGSALAVAGMFAALAVIGGGSTWLVRRNRA